MNGLSGSWQSEGVGYEALDNGFFRCEDPPQLQAICDELGPEDIERFLSRWLERLPLPLSAEDRQAGYDYRLSIWQLEVSLTQIFDRSLRGRQFFEEVIPDNLDLRRPDRVQLIFERQIRKNTPGTLPHAGDSERREAEPAYRIQVV